MAQKLIDETGNKYGSLIVLYKTKDKNNRTAWMCKCDCGNTKIARGSDLRSGRITTCGKGCPYKAERNKIYKDETGNRYGKLVVLYRNGTNSSNKPVWHCKCDCGNETDVVGGDLRSGRTMSCGCYSRDIASKRNFKDEVGNRFGRLTVIELIQKSPKAV